MALSAAASSVRGVVLGSLRISVTSSSQQVEWPSVVSIISRGFSAHFLDKEDVTARVLHVAKHFEKVDPAKVSGAAKGSLWVAEIIPGKQQRQGSVTARI